MAAAAAAGMAAATTWASTSERGRDIRSAGPRCGRQEHAVAFRWTAVAFRRGPQKHPVREGRELGGAGFAEADGVDPSVEARPDGVEVARRPATLVVLDVDALAVLRDVKPSKSSRCRAHNAPKVDPRAERKKKAEESRRKREQERQERKERRNKK